MKRVLTCIGIVALGCICAPHGAFAAAYYEFNPDYAQSMLLTSSQPISQVFLPLNEYLSGFDLWVSNAAQAGDIVYTLYSPAGTVLASRAVSVPAIADSSSGTRIHANFPSQFAVTGNVAYRILLSSSVPTMRVYYAPQHQLLAHNGSPVPAYTGGLARIGDQDMGFSFKFALYENHESAPPKISDVRVEQPQIGQAILVYSANEPIDRQVAYGAAAVDWSGQVTSCISGVQTCATQLEVTPGMFYAFTLTVRDAWGNTAAASGSFQALGESITPTSSATPIPTIVPTPTLTVTPIPDTTAPRMTNVRATSIDAHTTLFSWTTDEAANSFVVVQLLPYLITAGANSDAVLELEHAVRVHNLTPDTYYIAFLRSTNDQQLTTVASVSFLTLRETPIPVPSASSSPPAATTSPVPSGTPTVVYDDGTVVWSAPAQEPVNGYRIDVFTATHQLAAQVYVPAGQHSANVSGLPEGANRVVVYTNTDGVFEKVAPQATASVRRVSALERWMTRLPYVLGGAVLVIAVAVGTAVLIRHRKKALTSTPLVKPPVIL